MSCKLENWKGSKSLLGRWCHTTFFIISLAGSEGFNFAWLHLVSPNSSGLQCGTTLNWAERLKFLLSAMAAWNATEFRGVATKGPQSLSISWCSMYTLKNGAQNHFFSLQKAEITTLLKNDLSAGRKDGKYWLKESYPSSPSSFSPEPLNQGKPNFSNSQPLNSQLLVAKAVLSSKLCIQGPVFRLKHLNHPKTQIFGYFNGPDSMCLVWGERCTFQWFCEKIYYRTLKSK